MEEKITYRAHDGKDFEDMYECLEYECSLLGGHIWIEKIPFGTICEHCKKQKEEIDG